MSISLDICPEASSSISNFLKNTHYVFHNDGVTIIFSFFFFLEHYPKRLRVYTWLYTYDLSLAVHGGPYGMLRIDWSVTCKTNAPPALLLLWCLTLYFQQLYEMFCFLFLFIYVLSLDLAIVSNTSNITVVLSVFHWWLWLLNIFLDTSSHLWPLEKMFI